VSTRISFFSQLLSGQLIVTPLCRSVQNFPLCSDPNKMNLIFFLKLLVDFFSSSKDLLSLTERYVAWFWLPLFSPPPFLPQQDAFSLAPLGRTVLPCSVFTLRYCPFPYLARPLHRILLLLVTDFEQTLVFFVDHRFFFLACLGTVSLTSLPSIVLFLLLLGISFVC